MKTITEIKKNFSNEEIIEAEDESEAELDALVHCKMYLQEYVDVDLIEELE